MARARRRRSPGGTLPKAPTGIEGFDEITGGGLPRGRTTLVCGGTGTGKTLFAVEFLVRGVRQYREPGVFLAFEETEAALAQNVASLGLDLRALRRRGGLRVEHLALARSEIREMGEYDLEPIFLRLAHAIDAVGARRVAVDSLEHLFASLSDSGTLRAELCRLFRWLSDRGVTSLVTAESGEGVLTRNGLEEYVSDCVIALDQRVSGQIATRRLRVVKYRGTGHGADEYPVLVGDRGLVVMPITSAGLTHGAPTERLSSGIPDLDRMLGGEGYFRGSSVLVSGTAGSGKTSVAAHLVAAACRRGERCLMYLFEESPDQLVRNMRSIGVDLQPWRRQGLLALHAQRPSAGGLELHLASMRREVAALRPSLVVVDPVTNLTDVGTPAEARAMLVRLIDGLKQARVTTFFTSLATGGTAEDATSVGVSSLMDTWVMLRELETNGERNRLLHVLKSRGMAHSNQVREFRMTGRGIALAEVYAGPHGVLTGTARVTQEARERAEERVRREGALKQRTELARRRLALLGQLEGLRVELDGVDELLRVGRLEERDRRAVSDRDRQVMTRLRGGAAAPGRRPRLMREA